MQRKIDCLARLAVCRAIAECEMGLLPRRPNHGKRTPLTLADGLKEMQILRRNRQHVALLCLIAPRLQRTQPSLAARNRIQVKVPAATAVFDQLRECIRQPARAHIVNKRYRICFAALPATVDNLLRATLHLRVITLHRSKVQICVSAARAAGGCASAKSNQHGRTAQRDQCIAGLHCALLDMFRANIPQSACEHDRLVIPEDRALPFRVHACLFIGAEVSAKSRPPELIVVRSRAQRSFDHDVQRRSDVRGPSIRALPRLRRLRQIQIRHRKAAQPGLRLRSSAGCPLIANLTA